MPKRLDPDILLRVTEGFAEGSFEELFEYEWTDAERFIKNAYDYVEPKCREAFATELRQALARGRA